MAKEARNLKKNEYKLSELIEREASADDYDNYGQHVAAWFLEQYENFAFKLNRPDARLDTGEDKTMYSLEVLVGPEEDNKDIWQKLWHLVLSNNMDSEKLSMYVAKWIEYYLDDDAIKVISHSAVGDNITPLTGSQSPINDMKPIAVRVYFTKSSDKEETIYNGLNNDYVATEVYFVEDMTFNADGSIGLPNLDSYKEVD